MTQAELQSVEGWGAGEPQRWGPERGWEAGAGSLLLPGAPALSLYHPAWAHAHVSTGASCPFIFAPGSVHLLSG